MFEGSTEIRAAVMALAASVEWCSDTVVRQALWRETLRVDPIGADGQVAASDAVTYRSEALPGAAAPAPPAPATCP